jgi:hypothetical protein
MERIHLVITKSAAALSVVLVRAACGGGSAYYCD